MNVEIKVISKEEMLGDAIGMDQEAMKNFNEKRAALLAKLTATMFEKEGIAKTEIMKSIQENFEDKEILIFALRGVENDIDKAIKSLLGRKSNPFSKLLEAIEKAGIKEE